VNVESIEREDSLASLNFGQRNELDHHNSLPVPPEVKDWLRQTFSSVAEQRSDENRDNFRKITSTIKKFSANFFGKAFLCCASCCCLKCMVGDEKVNDVAQRITIATSTRPQVSVLDRKTLRKTRRNSLLLREQIQNNNMLQQQDHPIVYNEKDSKIMMQYHRDRLRKHLTYPNNVKFRSQKPPFRKKLGNCLKSSFCFCSQEKRITERPSITSINGNRTSVRSQNRIQDINANNSSNQNHSKNIPVKVKLFFKDQVNLWEFNIFKLPTEGHTPLKWMILDY